MNIYSSFVDVSRMVNIVGLYIHVHVWLVNRGRLMSEVDL